MCLQSHSSESREFTLLRFPEQGKQSALQAWDSADEYLLNYLHDHIADIKAQQQSTTHTTGITLPRLAILNDDFGALSCALSDLSPHVFSDSFMAHIGITQNCQRNNLAAPLLQSSLALANFCTKSTDSNPKTSLDFVLIKIPRTLALLQQQLADLRPALSANTKIIASGKVNTVTTKVLKLFERCIGETKTSLAVKKSRLIFAQFNPVLSCPPLPVSQVNDPEIDFTLYNHANVFCREQLDIGARLLLSYLPTRFSGTCIDLGCGNGVLGVSMLRTNPHAHVHFVDESHMAIASAKMTADAALDARIVAEQTDFTLSHCLQSLIDKRSPPVDLILCNPPFHQQNVVTDQIAWQMFVDAKRMLKANGELRIVANRHLHYPDKLKRLFGACKVIASNRKFVVLSVIKAAS